MDHSCVGMEGKYPQRGRITAELSQHGGTNRIQSDETNTEVLQRSFARCVKTSCSTAASLHQRERDGAAGTKLQVSDFLFLCQTGASTFSGSN